MHCGASVSELYGRSICVAWEVKYPYQIFREEICPPNCLMLAQEMKIFSIEAEKYIYDQLACALLYSDSFLLHIALALWPTVNERLLAHSQDFQKGGYRHVCNIDIYDLTYELVY